MDHAARQAGDDLFGLRLIPHLSVDQYGTWGNYVLEAPTLHDALMRASSIIHLHANKDTLVLRLGPHSSRLEYTFAERSGGGCRQVALAALGPALSIPRHFLGNSWTPFSIDLDLSDTTFTNAIEAGLGTKVHSNQGCVAIEIPNKVLGKRNTVSQRYEWTTVHDVERACNGGPPRGYIPAVRAIVLQRLGSQKTTIEDIAMTMSTSRRTMQRRLDREGTSYRELIGAVKMHSATELLLGSPSSVSEFGAQLDYATAGHFARAFRKAYDMSPLEYRAAFLEVPVDPSKD